MAQDAVYIAHLAKCTVNDYTPNSVDAYSSACRAVQTLVAQINTTYTGTTSADRLAYLKRRRGLLLARAAVIQGSMVELGAQDVTDKTAATIGGIGGAVAGLFGVIPGIGGAIGTFIGLGTQLVAGLFDHSADKKAAQAAELNELQIDYINLKTLYDEHTAEINSLMLPRYVLYGTAGIVLIALLIVLLRSRKS
ncbi:hypothetical protein [Fibrella forsythiae]|uniref:DUF456 domain-containing protein n=1 Tax=Fibrella forsythiae TaxID=2817061 RepID=A0ABS3JAJ2_9BACT|nr:hypothetical protein [Fibrella forsythiae]MBO0947007.1 hypothetical protein [Fibrella forsythiae]